MSIYKKISDFHAKVGALKKSSTNPHYKSKYSDIDTVLDAIREPLKNAGLSFVQIPQNDGLKTILAEIEGEDKIEAFLPYVLAKNDMQGLGSAITYARRYSLVAILGLEAEDDDGNKALPQQPKQQQAKQEQPKTETLGVYLAQRGLTPEQIKAFYLKNAITKDNSLEYLKDKQKIENMLVSFLAIKV